MIGIDVGSTNIKIVDGKSFKKYPIIKLNEILEKYNNEESFATGYFRKRFKNYITEITAAIYGIDKDVEVIIDIGGQDTKIINTKTLEFIMNDKCGAGTGLFLQTIAMYLNVPIEDFGKYYSKNPLNLNNTCAVFSISEIINYLVSGYTIKDIIASVNYTIAKKIANINPYECETLTLIGGVAENKAFVRYFKEITEKEVYVPKNPQFINAIGARKYGIKYSTKNHL
ncbi:acyl-CoA dehydratase activase [Methanocaldococcus indicus]|uniref:acyl-CoA dehydratase activase n=1 Tax=Methanocaldococcus indicus TaxID=213231 RepID=UPI003C6CE730